MTVIHLVSILMYGGERKSTGRTSHSTHNRPDPKRAESQSAVLDAGGIHEGYQDGEALLHERQETVVDYWDQDLLLREEGEEGGRRGAGCEGVLVVGLVYG